MNGLDQDYKTACERVGDDWKQLRGQRVLLTGGTGFFGLWLISTFLYANRQFGLGAEMTVVSRSPEGFLAKHPEFRGRPDLKWIQGDIRNFPAPENAFSHVIHAAADVLAPSADPLEIFDVAYAGTKRVIETCRPDVTKRFLLVSSGAVYGARPETEPSVSEDASLPARLDRSQAYALGKQMSEWLVLNSSALQTTNCSIARCFAFVGPHMALESPFAVTDFFKHVLNGETIEIAGDGTPLRSYMYAADLAVWLWTMLFRGANREIFNVGSDDPVSIADLAKEIIEISHANVGLKVLKIGDSGRAPNRYLPNIQKARAALGLTLQTDRRQALEKTLDYYRSIRR